MKCEKTGAMEHLNRQDGFTLIELLVAIVILSIGILGMGSLTVAIIQGNRYSNDLSVATTLGQDKMEEVRELGYAGTPSNDTTATEGYSSIANYPSFKRVTFTDVDNPATGMKMVTVTVYWDADNHSIELKTILAQ